MKLEKISLIEPPHPEVTLGIGEMDNVLGGVVCDAYTHCNGTLTSTCTSYDSSSLGQCGGDKDTSHVLCSSHQSTCKDYVKPPVTCSSYSF